MNFSDVHAHEAILPRGASFVLFLLSGLLLFELEFFAFKGGGRIFQIATLVGLPLLFSAVAILVRRSSRFAVYWPAFFSYSLVSIALFFSWLLDDSPIRWLGLDPKSPKGTALGKVSDIVVLVVIVVVLTRAFRVSRRGRGGGLGW